MQILTINDYGTYLGKHSERLVIKYREKDRPNDEFPLMDMEQLIVSSKGVSLSSDLVEACIEHGIEISFINYGGQPYAKLISPALSATVISRREQIAAYKDERGFEIAKRFISGKTQNQINLVRYFAKYRKKRSPSQYNEILERVHKMQELLKELDALEIPNVDYSPIDALRGLMLNLEGRASAIYWECVRRLLPKGKFQKREHRGTEDDVNVLLNYGYGILYSQVWSALSLAGLEPFAGFLHVDRPGKPSLVLDFIEEFRQTVVDKTVFAMINKRFKVEWEAPDGDPARSAHQSSKPNSDNNISEQRYLSKETRHAMAERILARLQERETFEHKQHKLINIIQQQARHLAMFLRKEGDYKPFISKW